MSGSSRWMQSCTQPALVRKYYVVKDRKAVLPCQPVTDNGTMYGCKMQADVVFQRSEMSILVPDQTCMQERMEELQQNEMGARRRGRAYLCCSTSTLPTTAQSPTCFCLWHYTQHHNCSFPIHAETHVFWSSEDRPASRWTRS